MDDTPGVLVQCLPDWGWCGVAATGKGVVAVRVAGSDRATTVGELIDALGGRAGSDRLAERGFQGLRPGLNGDDLPVVEIDLAGTEFQIRVWRGLSGIDRGTTLTYGQFAESIGVGSHSARAVGRALGANPVPILLPCHRVVPASGGTGGYRFGTAYKAMLLAKERH